MPVKRLCLREGGGAWELGRAPVGGQGLEDSLSGCEATGAPQSEQKVREMWEHCLSITVPSMELSKPSPKLGHYLGAGELQLTWRHAEPLPCTGWPGTVPPSTCSGLEGLARPSSLSPLPKGFADSAGYEGPCWL